MFFKTDSKPDPQTGIPSIYYRLIESYRDILGTARHRTILPVGRMDEEVGAEWMCLQTL